MYVSRVLAKNFGTIELAEKSFTDGLNVIRGPNEAGKSTLVEAVLYGMFGVNALRGTVEETVRAGCKPSDLGVELDYGEYEAKRTKSSASVIGPGVKISGQGNVSEFFYSLLGIQKGNERSVLIAEQGKTAGILDGKPGDVSTLIEGLAGFTQIDSVIEKIKHDFPSGNQALLEEMLEEEKVKLLAKKEIKPEDHNIFLEKVKNWEASLKVADGEIEDLRSSISSKDKELAEIDAGVKLKEKLAADIEEVQAGIEVDNTAIETATAASKAIIPNVSEETKLVNDYPAAVEKWNLYVEVTSFDWDGDKWDGSRESLDAEIKSVASKVEIDSKTLADSEAEVRSIRRRINNDTTCGECGQDITKIHAELNTKLEKELVAATEKIVELNGSLEDSKGTLDTLNNIVREQKERTDYKEYAVAEEVFPWTLEWKGEAPVKPSNKSFTAAKKAISESEAIERSVEQALKDIEKLSADSTEKINKHVALQQEFNNMFVQDGADLKAIIIVLKHNLEGMIVDREVLVEEISRNEKEAVRIKTYADSLAKGVSELEVKVVEIKGRMKEDKDNALILSEARKAKHKVLNKVWESVLASVSRSFSDMRGYESTVKKTEKGFAVDGIPVHRLSGSAKSILGIAVRSALRDIFAPAAGFMSLDEPSSDCGEERTALVVAAIVSIKGQVLVITHEDISDGSADTIIDLT